MKYFANVFVLLALLCAACGGDESTAQETVAEHLAAHWATLPVTIAAVEPNELEAIEIFNEFYGAQMFEVGIENPQVEIIHEQIENAGEDLVGRTHRFSSNTDGTLSRATITIIPEIEPEADKYFAVFLHELGHVIGFTGHEQSGDVLMFYSIADRDKNETIAAFENDQLLHDVIVELYF